MKVSYVCTFTYILQASATGGSGGVISPVADLFLTFWVGRQANKERGSMDWVIQGKRWRKTNTAAGWLASWLAHSQGGAAKTKE